jgi:hypothetical protein
MLLLFMININFKNRAVCPIFYGYEDSYKIYFNRFAKYAILSLRIIITIHEGLITHL